MFESNYDLLVDCDNTYIAMCDEDAYKKLFKVGDKVRAVSYWPEGSLPSWFEYDSVGTIKEIMNWDKVLLEYRIKGKKRYIAYSIYQIVHDNPVFKQSDYYKKCGAKDKLR